MEAYADFDRTEFPLITIHFTGEKETPENFEVYLQELGKNYEHKKDLALIFELTKAPVPNVSYQLKQASWMKENDALIKQYCKGVAYVIPSMILRGVLKFIFSVQKNPVPFKVFSNYADGKQWASSLL